MGRIKLGRTGLVVEKQGFGCLPIQRISKAEAVELLHRAYDGGMNYCLLYTSPSPRDA